MATISVRKKKTEPFDFRFPSLVRSAETVCSLLTNGRFIISTIFNAFCLNILIEFTWRISRLKFLACN